MTCASTWEIWDATKVYDRMGMDSEYTEILGIKVPVMTIPVKPGRNLAIIIEVAAMNNRQKKMGYNAAYELLSALGMVVAIAIGFLASRTAAKVGRSLRGQLFDKVVTFYRRRDSIV